MGFYSLYKIIKDVIRTLFGGKFLKFFMLVIIIFIFMFFFNKSKVCAMSSTSYYGESVEFPDIPSNIYNDNQSVIVYKRYDNGNIQLVVSNYYETSPYYPYASSPVQGDIYLYPGPFTRYSIVNNEWQYLGTGAGYMECSDIYFTLKDIHRGQSQFVFMSGSPIITTKYPQITTSLSDLQSLNFDVVSVDAWDYSTTDLYLLCYDRNSTASESLTNLYPVNEILLDHDSSYFMNDISADPQTNSIYWIPKEQIGFNWVVGGSYAFRFATREPIESDYSEWAYNYIGDILEFTVNSDVSQTIIDDLNNNTDKFIEQQRHDETMQAINQQTENSNNFYNNIMSNDYNENQIDDTLSGATSSTDSIDDSQYTGLFSAIFSKFSNIINGDYSTVERIEYPVMNTNQSIVVTSDILSSHIKGTFIYIFLQMLWYFLFGMYIFKFSNDLIRRIKSGSILNGYENNNEVITSTML